MADVLTKPQNPDDARDDMSLSQILAEINRLNHHMDRNKRI